MVIRRSLRHELNNIQQTLSFETSWKQFNPSNYLYFLSKMDKHLAVFHLRRRDYLESLILISLK